MIDLGRQTYDVEGLVKRRKAVLRRGSLIIGQHEMRIEVERCSKAYISSKNEEVSWKELESHKLVLQLQQAAMKQDEKQL